MTSDALKPQLSDLDKLFDSEDEGGDDRPANQTSMMNGGAQATAHSASSAAIGGASMASAHAQGPVSKCIVTVNPYLYRSISNRQTDNNAVKAWNNCQGITLNFFTLGFPNNLLIGQIIDNIGTA